MNANPALILTWVLASAMPVAATVVLAGFLNLIPYEVMLEIARKNFAAIVGLPVAAVFAVFLVVVLQQTSGPVKFEGLGFKFEGTSGQVVLWMLCFLDMGPSSCFGCRARCASTRRLRSRKRRRASDGRQRMLS